jgi:AraC family transcriptional regulator
VTSNPPDARPAPRAEFARRMHRVQLHIDQHLGEPLEVADLAAVAHFSPFHFHRLFTAWMGETLGEHVRRRRLEVAALRLLTQPRSSVLEIALTVGFGSGEAFAHAFKARFACSASQWRRAKAQERASQLSKLDQAQRKHDQAPAADDGDDGDALQLALETRMNVTVIERPATRVAYLRYTGPYGAGVHSFWKERFIPFLAQHQLFGRPILGVSHDDPLITAPEQCRYDTCVQVDEGQVIGGDALITTIAGGKYASLPFKGTSAAIGPAWTGLMRDWLPQSGWQLDGRPTFEYYAPGAAYDEATGSFECDIVIPLAPL